MNQINIQITLKDMMSIIELLGNLPTSSNAWPLIKNLEDQILAQTKPEAESENGDSSP